MGGCLPSGSLSDWAWWRSSLAKAAYLLRAASSQRRSASFLLAINFFSVSSPAVHAVTCMSCLADEVHRQYQKHVYSCSPSLAPGPSITARVQESLEAGTQSGEPVWALVHLYLQISEPPFPAPPEYGKCEALAGTAYSWGPNPAGDSTF